MGTQVYMREPNGRIFYTSNPEWHTGAERIKTKKEGKSLYLAQLAADLREVFPPGAHVYTVLRHVARSGMARHLSVVAMVDGAPVDVTYRVAQVCGMRTNARGHIVVGGCGFDAGFHVAYDLGATLYPAGFTCIGAGCPSNDHSNGDRDYTAGKIHKDGGYAFRHSWL